MAAEKRSQLWTRELPEPECPPGWRTGPPDFVGVGAQRCGTTWWYRGAIRPHPGFTRPFKPRKEVHFFDRFWAGSVPDDFAERYARLFPRPDGAITGEWTPRYMCDFWALRLLAAAAPKARILIMLRDPVERYRSGLERELRLVGEDEDPPNIAIVGDAIHRSLYAKQVERVMELFGREQVLVLQYERCVRDPLEEMRRTQEFLGLEPLTDVPPRLRREREVRPDRFDLPPDFRADLAGMFEEDALRVASLCPELELELWPSVAG